MNFVSFVVLFFCFVQRSNAIIKLRSNLACKYVKKSYRCVCKLYFEHKPIKNNNNNISLKLFQQALSIQETELGHDDIRLMSSLTALGRLYMEQRDYAKAQASFERALNICQQVLYDVCVCVTVHIVRFHSVSNISINMSIVFLFKVCRRASPEDSCRHLRTWVRKKFVFLN